MYILYRADERQNTTGPWGASADTFFASEQERYLGFGTLVQVTHTTLNVNGGNSGMMLHAPLPFVGIRGVRYVANKLRKLPRASAAEQKHARLFIGHMVRMQEEIGTGGAGFRFLHASFLQEAAPLVGKPELVELSNELTRAGDEWRAFALAAAKMCKQREALDPDQLAGRLHRCADLESEVHKKLRAL